MMHLLSFVLSTILSFYTTALVVQAVIYCFQMKRYRTRYFLHFIPFVAVILDGVMHEYSVGNWLNPLSCSSCTQKLFLHVFFPDLQNYLSSNQISLIRYLSFEDPYQILKIIMSGITIVMISRKLLQIIVANRYVKKIIKQGTLNQVNTHLKSVQIVNSKEILVPMATTRSVIVMPTDIKNLSQDEYEAIIAHELEHIYWKDPEMKLFLHLFRASLWWIPTKFWIKKMEECQEMGCDQEILNQSILKENLASALIKVASYKKNQTLVNVCFFKENRTLKRIRAISSSYTKEKVTFVGIAVISCGILLLMLCLFL